MKVGKHLLKKPEIFWRCVDQPGIDGGARTGSKRMTARQRRPSTRSWGDKREQTRPPALSAAAHFWTHSGGNPVAFSLSVLFAAKLSD